MSVSFKSKHISQSTNFLKSKIFLALWAIWSLLWPLSSATVLLKQPLTIYKHGLVPIKLYFYKQVPALRL